MGGPKRSPVLQRMPPACRGRRTENSEFSSCVGQYRHRLVFNKVIPTSALMILTEESPCFELGSSRLHADRVARRHRDHRDPHRPVASRRAEDSRGREPDEVLEQPEANRLGDAQFPRHEQSISLGLHVHQSRAGLRRRPRARLGLGRQLLPFLEQDNLYRQIDFTKDITHPANKTPRMQVLNVFICPVRSRAKDLHGRFARRQ